MTPLLIDAHDLGPGLLKEAGVAVPQEVTGYDIPRPEALDDYPDEDFGVVMLDGGTKLRKYACMNPGVAWLNSQYLMAGWEGLPKTAAAVAGMRLLDVMDDGGLEPPEGLEEKVAEAIEDELRGEGVLLEVDGIHVPVVDITGCEKMAVLGAVRGLGQAMMRTGRGVMKAPAGGARLTPQQATKGVGNWARYYGGQALRHTGAAVARNPGAAAAVGGAGVLGGGYMLSKAASGSVRLLGDKYPADTLEEVKQASNYFERYGQMLHPAQRREYCVKLAAQAEAFEIEVPECVTKYAGQEIGTDILLHMATRGRMVDERGQQVLQKLAEAIPHSDPDTLADTLVQFDEHYGLSQEWDKRLPDPYAAVCSVKVAQEYVWSEGVDRVSETDINSLIQRDIGNVSSALGEDVAQALVKNPVGGFKSLPDPHKRIVARLATSGRPGGGSVNA